MTRPAADGAPVGREEVLAAWRAVGETVAQTANRDFAERLAIRKTEAHLATPPTARTVNPPVSDPEGDSPVSGVSADRTAGDLNADDLGRTVTVTITGRVVDIESGRGFAIVVLTDGSELDIPADTPVHVRDEEAGR